MRPSPSHPFGMGPSLSRSAGEGQQQEMQPVDFILHDRLAADTVALGDARLSAVRLMNDRRYPWLILVPRRSGLREIHELAVADRTLLIEEIALAGQLLQAIT